MKRVHEEEETSKTHFDSSIAVHVVSLTTRTGKSKPERKRVRYPRRKKQTATSLILAFISKASATIRPCYSSRWKSMKPIRSPRSSAFICCIRFKTSDGEGGGSRHVIRVSERQPHVYPTLKRMRTASAVFVYKLNSRIRLSSRLTQVMKSRAKASSSMMLKRYVNCRDM